MNNTFSENDLLQIARRFDRKAESVEFLRKSHNYTYKVICSNNSFILRISSDEHRTINQVLSEIDFQLYLYENGASVVSPLFTCDDEKSFVVVINKHKYIAAAFSLASGLNWDNRPSDCTPERLINTGKELGKIHRLSMKYNPEHVGKRRLWNESQHLIKAYELFRSYDEKLYSDFVEYMDYMNKLPKDNHSFGLTHGDYLGSNYMIDENNHVTVFDFDECEYSWYVADIAICMHCTLIGPDPTKLESKTELAEVMLYNLAVGYISENKLSKDMIMNLQLLFKMRDFIYFSTILEWENVGEWGKNFISTCLDRILNKKPFLEFDMSQTLNLL